MQQVFPGCKDYEKTLLPSDSFSFISRLHLFFFFCRCVMYIQKGTSNTSVQSDELSQAEHLHTTPIITTHPGQNHHQHPRHPAHNHNAEFRCVHIHFACFTILTLSLKIFL